MIPSQLKVPIYIIPLELEGAELPSNSNETIYAFISEETKRLIAS